MCGCSQAPLVIKHGQVVCEKCGENAANMFANEQLSFDLTEPTQSPWMRCECGAEKVYGQNTGHSPWCKKYQRP